MDGAGYQTVNGTPTWIVERGAGEATILLLHGGLGNSDELLDSIGPDLARRYRLVAFDRKGHGRTADDGLPFHYDAMTEETRAVMAHLGIAPTHVVGWSDGGIIALLLALRHPELVRRAVLIGANFHHSGFKAADFGSDAPFFKQVEAGYAERALDGGRQFGGVVARVTRMWTTEPTLAPGDLQQVAAPVLVMAADRDAVTLEHTVTLFENLPHGQLAVVPGTSHDLPEEEPALVARLILDFLA
ncbi:MAG: alpha/beta hydrolase [Devosia sp.]|nr:alpha/beta hydrolase [Devosia sp.]